MFKIKMEKEYTTFSINMVGVGCEVDLLPIHIKTLDYELYEDLKKYAENLRQKKNCFRLLNGEKPLKKISIPYAISVLITQQLTFQSVLETQDNGRNIWEQTAKQLLRTYNSKGGFKRQYAKK